MRPSLTAFRAFVAGLLLLVAVPALAQGVAPEEAWQKVITGQIEAFRHGDAPEAFALAGTGFQDTFPNAVTFFEVIIASGYAPIMLSKSHSFGAFQRTDDKGVAQVVKFVGPHQEIYEAVYQLVEEANGWRVQGVSLGKPAGIAV